MNYLFGVLFTNGTSGEIEITARDFEEARAKMLNNLCLADFWTDARSPHFDTSQK